VPADVRKLPPESRSPVQASTPLWREELSGRVQKFRRRRARLRTGFDPTTTLDLDFRPDADREIDADEIDTSIDGRLIEFGEHARQLGAADDATQDDSILDSATLRQSGAGLRVLSGAAVQAGELPLGQQNISAESVEIILDPVRSSEHGRPAPLDRASDPWALLGRRFLAGLVDTFLLLVGAAVFAAIFWIVCLRSGAVSVRLANLIAMSLAVAFLILFYFGMSIALTATTPGLAFMGLEVRNLDGELPSTRDSFWRAFGYLVSTSALFLGFVWALLDADGLTWHDLMSETYVTNRH
jgi:uncharacterized RDD family membrane protein YckC